jgi:hypothetical protein
MAREKKKGFLTLLTSGWVLLPLVASLSLLQVVYFFELDPTTWGLFPAIFGAVAILGFLAMWLFAGGPRVPAEIQQARDELIAHLDTLGRTLQRRLANESTSAGSMAPVEK